MLCLMLARGCSAVPPALADSEIVYQTIAMEGANQSLEGQSLIAGTLLNRALIRGTKPEVEAMRPKQYSCWNDRNRAKTWLRRHFDSNTRTRAIQALERARNASKWHPTHYHTLQVMPYWARGHKPCVVVGNHAFYEGIK